jgi:hypothetical protein
MAGMADAQVVTGIERHILRGLREFYPIKIDEIVLISTVQKSVKDASIEHIAREIRHLRDRGFIEESIVEAPFGKAETNRFKITSLGIEHLQSIEGGGVITDATTLGEIESRLVETYDRIKADMESMRQDLERTQRELAGSIEGISNRITDHDQVIRTYFVRVIETFGVFVGIFAVVVVAMLGSINAATALPKVGMDTVIIILVAIPIILVTVILSLLFGIRELVLKAPKD